MNDNRWLGGLAVLLLAVVAMPAQAQLAPYSTDFEGVDPWGDTSLMNDGWLVFGNVWGPDWGYWYGYGPFGAPNQTAGFSSIAEGQGGADQGDQQVVTYSDYLNANHWDNSGAFIEANFFQEQVISAGDLGTTWRFEFDVKHGDLAGGTTASAFFKVVDITPCCSVSVFPIDVTGMPAFWTRHSMDIYIDPSWEGNLLQFGFANLATNHEFSGMLYDNVAFGPAPIPVSFDVKPQSCPNPVNTWSQGVIPTAVMGDVDFDVLDLDIGSLALEGVAPVHAALEDVGAPGGFMACACSPSSPDGLTDLTLHFDTQAVIDALGGGAPVGEYSLRLTGELLDGTPIEGVDCIVSVGGGNKVMPVRGIEQRRTRTSDRGGVEVGLRPERD